MNRPGALQSRWAEILGHVRRIADEAVAAGLLEQLVAGEESRSLAFVNAHAMNRAAADSAFYKDLCDTDVLLRDGSGMALLYRLQAREPGLNMNGTDFIPRLLAAYVGRPVALWGSAEPWLSIAAARCEAEFGLRVVSREDGFRPPEHYCALARAGGLELIVLGMGMPKQERVAGLVRAAAAGAPLIVCGGAILDFLGGKVPRAPPWMRRLGLEWAYRLGREPLRLFQRYVLGNPLFVLRAWRSRALGAP